jgi:hypothetical protein
VVQPVTAALVRQYDGARSEQLQALMMSGGQDPSPHEVEAFCQRARALFAEQIVAMTKPGPSPGIATDHA